MQGDVRAYSGVILCIHLTVFHIAGSEFGTGDADGVHISVQRKLRVSRQMPLAFRESVRLHNGAQGEMSCFRRCDMGRMSKA